MIKHVFTLVWNRRRTNALIVAEVLISFLVVCAVLTMGIHYLTNYMKPLGFDYENIWSIDVSTGLTWTGLGQSGAMNTTRQLLETVRGYPEVTVAAGILVTPFGGSTWRDNVDNINTAVMYDGATDDLPQLLGLKLLQGRWFDQTDDAQNWNPAVINASLRDKLFGNEDPLGKTLIKVSEHRRKEVRVVGVIDDFRLKGELRAPFDLYLSRLRLDDTLSFHQPDLLVRVQPGTPPEFEERLMSGLNAAAPGWSFSIQPLSKMRKAQFTERLAPLGIIALIAGFLLLMVGFGLLGVLWQNVTRRTAEIGLRRALGAHARSVYLQILAEILVVATIGLAIGTLIVIQFPLLGIDEDISLMTYVVGLLLSIGVIYFLAAACGLYPGWLASRIGPAAALHYE
jgi:putative ABC transport system permease protein